MDQARELKGTSSEPLVHTHEDRSCSSLLIRTNLALSNVLSISFRSVIVIVLTVSLHPTRALAAACPVDLHKAARPNAPTRTRRQVRRDRLGRGLGLVERAAPSDHYARPMPLPLQPPSITSAGRPPLHRASRSAARYVSRETHQPHHSRAPLAPPIATVQVSSRDVRDARAPQS